jgi:hypothetical protein
MAFSGLFRQLYVLGMCWGRLHSNRSLCAVAALCLSALGGAVAAADLPLSRTEPPASPDVVARQLFSPTPIATDPKWAMTIFVGAGAGDDRLLELLARPWSGDFRDDYFVGGALSRKLVRFWNYVTIEAELGVGARFGQTNGGEAWGAFYLRFDGFPWNRFVYTTFAVSTGLHFISELPLGETYPGDRTSHVLHYFSPEFTLAHPQYKNHELVVRYHHRSGVFGQLNGVRGGSNVIALGYRHRFDSFER